MKQTHGFKNITVTATRVRGSFRPSGIAPLNEVARVAVSAQMGYPCILTRVIAQEAGEWMEWEYVAA